MSKASRYKKLVYTAMLYRIIGILFAVGGLVVFSVLYFKDYKGDLGAAMTDPFLIVLVLGPFIPAAVFSALSSHFDRKARKLFENKTR